MREDVPPGGRPGRQLPRNEWVDSILSVLNVIYFSHILLYSWTPTAPEIRRYRCRYCPNNCTAVIVGGLPEIRRICLQSPDRDDYVAWEDVTGINGVDIR